MSPYRSKLKDKYFNYLESKGKMPKISDDDHEDDEGYAYGGMVDDEDAMYDYEMGNESEYNSSGDPHTEDKKEDDQPMEYMSRGGRVRRMSNGGIAKESGFVQALRKKMY